MTIALSSLNFRDLGGMRARGGRIRDGLLFRSEGPRNFDADQLRAMGAIGFRTIVDLRSAGERTEVPHDWHGPDCRWLKLDVNADLRVFGNEGRERLLQGPDATIAIATMAETYREIVGALLPHWPAIAGVLTRDTVPVVFNCTAGKDRTGVAIALLLELAGVPRDAIIDDYMRSAVFGENLVRNNEVEPGFMASFGFMPSHDQIQALIGVRTEYLEAAWDEIARRWSTVPEYFSAAGLDAATQQRIRNLLLEQGTMT